MQQNKIYIPQRADYIRCNEAARADFLESTDLSWQHIEQHYPPIKDIEDWRKLMPNEHWQPGKSAYELATSWINTNPNLPNEIAALFTGNVTLLSATPEHQTPLPDRGYGSCSDVLAFVETNEGICAVAIEGKKDEGFSDTVGEWLKKAKSGTTKPKRLQSIADKLGLPDLPHDEIHYQLLHRTAAAVIEAEKFNVPCAAMIVHSFSHKQQGFKDFAAFLKLFGIDAAQPGKLYSSKVSVIPLSLGWATAPKSR